MKLDNNHISDTDRAWINALYKEFQPSTTDIIVNTCKSTQLLGIDIYLSTPNNNWVTIDEKMRKEEYSDILLEEFSNWERKTPGWTWDTKKINDFVGYIIIPTHKFWLLDAPSLRMLWEDQYSSWLQHYERKFGKTYSSDGIFLYHTSNIALPIPVLSSVIIFSNQSQQLSLLPLNNPPRKKETEKN